MRLKTGTHTVLRAGNLGRTVAYVDVIQGAALGAALVVNTVANGTADVMVDVSAHEGPP